MSNLVQSVADAINLEMKRQLDGKHIPGTGPEVATSWSAEGDFTSLDLAEIAKVAVKTAMERVSEEARRYASHYPQSSDGRNTFTLFAEWAERQQS